MASLTWNSVLPNFSGSSQAMANAQRGIGQAGQIADSVLDNYRKDETLKLQEQQLGMQKAEHQMKLDARNELLAEKKAGNEYAKFLESALSGNVVGTQDQAKLAAIGMDQTLSPEARSAKIDAVLPQMTKSYESSPVAQLQVLRGTTQGKNLNSETAMRMLQAAEQPLEKSLDRQETFKNQNEILDRQNKQQIALQGLVHKNALESASFANKLANESKTYYNPKTKEIMSGAELFRSPRTDVQDFMDSKAIGDVALLSKDQDPLSKTIFYGTDANGKETGAMSHTDAAAWRLANPDGILDTEAVKTARARAGGTTGVGGGKGGKGATGALAFIENDPDKWNRFGSGDAVEAHKNASLLLALGVPDSTVEHALKYEDIKGGGVLGNRTFSLADIDNQGLTIQTKDGKVVPAGKYISAFTELGGTVAMTDKGPKLSYKRADGSSFADTDVLKELKKPSSVSTSTSNLNTTLGSGVAIDSNTAGTVLPTPSATAPTFKDLENRQRLAELLDKSSYFKKQGFSMPLAEQDELSGLLRRTVPQTPIRQQYSQSVD